MKKLLLLLACSCFILAKAQNSVNITSPNHNHKKQTVRQMAAQKDPMYKRLQQRGKMAKAKAANLNKGLNNRSSSCFSYSTDNNGYTNIVMNYNPSDSIVSWVWNYGDGSADTTTIYSNYVDSLSYYNWHYYAQPNGTTSSYLLCVTTINNHGLSNNCCDTITVANTLPTCYSNFSYSVDSLNGVSFVDYSSSDSTIVGWSWDFGDSTSSTLQNPSHQYAQAGTYTVCLTITSSSGCNGTYCYPVNVNDFSHSCSASFYYTADSVGNGFSFTDISSVGNATIVSWSWDFGDNSALGTSQNPSHIYAQTGTYNVCLTINSNNGCSSTNCEVINIGGNQTSHLVVDTISNLSQTLSTMLFGSCVSVSNLTYTGASGAIGYFVDTTNAIDSTFTHGLLLTTGSVFNAVGPNNSTSAGTDNGLPGDSDLDALIPGYTTHDAAKIEFDFTSASDTLIASKIVFASEEYPEFVGTAYNDVFGFYISGPGINGVKNLAVIPNTSDPISINSVNPNQNSSYYVDNTGGTTYQYDGRTSVIQLKQAIVPGQTYHFKIAIADAGDGIYDSGVMIKAGSFNGNTALPQAHFTTVDSGLTVQFSNGSINSTVYGWNFGDGTTSLSANPSHTYAAPGTYHVTLLASNVCYGDTVGMNITIGATGISSLTNGNVMKLFPTLSEGVYNASILSSVNEKVEIRIYTLSGQLLFNKSYNNTVGQNDYTVDLSAYAHGLYSVQILGTKNMFVSKVVR